MKNLQTNWNFKLLFANIDDPKILKKRHQLEKVYQDFFDHWKNNDRYLVDPRTLKLALDEYEKLEKLFGFGGLEYYYFELKANIDQEDPQIKAHLNQIEELAIKLLNQIQFFTIKLSKIPQSNQDKFLNEPTLNNYKHFLENLFKQGQYLLSENEEKILNLKSITSYTNWVKLTEQLLSKDEGKVITEEGKIKSTNLSEMMSLMSNSKKEIRDKAAKSFNNLLKRHLDVAESEVNTILADKKINDELRGMNRADLARHLADDIDSEVVDSLVMAVADRYDLSARFYQLKSKLLGVKRLKYHERNIEYGSLGNQRYDFKTGCEVINKTFEKLDQDFKTIFNDFLANGQIDVYPHKNKRSGAACFNHLISDPTFILLNYTDRLSDVTTLAHEVGHGINNELMKKAQNALNFGSPLSTAEVASTFMEDFVLNEILQNTSDEIKLEIQMAKLNDDISVIFRQIACYQFETELHNSFRQKSYLSKIEIGEIFQKHMRNYMGKSVEQNPDSQNWWVYWSHIRMFFYVYSYASGLLISKSLQNQVKHDPSTITKVKQFLSSGCSDSPKNIFLKLGLDITQKQFWSQGLNEVEILLDSAENLAKSLGKI